MDQILRDLMDEASKLEIPTIPGKVEVPCNRCKHFIPRPLFNKYGAFDGMRLCWAETMYRDFSCVEIKEEAAAK